MTTLDASNPATGRRSELTDARRLSYKNSRWLIIHISAQVVVATYRKEPFDGDAYDTLTGLPEVYNISTRRPLFASVGVS